MTNFTRHSGQATDRTAQEDGKPSVVITFAANWPLPNGELVLSNFELELDTSGDWVLYKQAHWESDRIKITADVAAAAERWKTRVTTILAAKEKAR
jgi:hypothetical protein